MRLPNAALLLCVGSAVFAFSRASLAATPSATQVTWETLGELDYKTGTASAKVKALDGKELRVAGFIVPLDFSEAREVSEFLLTPSYPGCIHVPPPTPAQTILVKMEKGKKAKMSWGPIWTTGKLKLVLEKKSGYGEASYQMTGLSTADYDITEAGDKLVNFAITGGAPIPMKKK
ncbi:MAG: DUF3299 domain-containing protein [Bdellovibrionota bacterium]